MTFHTGQSRPPLTPRRLATVISLLGGILVLTGLAALAMGSVSIPFANVVRALTGGSVSETERTILLEIRLPRVLMAMTVGAGLSVAGLVFQAMLRNPLAEPYILGISSGGTVGAIIAITFSFGALGTPLASFIGSALVMLLVYLIGHRRGHLDANTLLLGGVMVGAFFNAAILLIIALSRQELRNAFLWLMGNLSNADTSSALIVGPLVAATAAVLLLQARRFNLIATGDETATQLGIDVNRVRRTSYVLASLITGLAVSVSGVVGFVGLIIPHICRMIFGPDHRLLLPASFLAGAAFLVIADTFSRTVLAPTEIPVGAITAAIGAPFFVYLLRKV
jgi:iron complex transport system permease protein